MGSECHFQRYLMRVILKLNEEPVWGITISYPPQYEERTWKTPHLPKESKPSDLTLQGTYFHTSIHCIFNFNH